jgi:hypothetical protein
MATITLAEVRLHVETDLTDTALQMLIDDADAEIDEVIGLLTSETDEFNDERTSKLFLTRKATSITSVVEENWGTAVTLSANDHKLRLDGRMIERLNTGTNPASVWGDVVTIVYTPQDDTKRRKVVIIDLVKLALVYNGQKSESVGDYSATMKEYDDERQRLINRLRSSI